MSETDPIPFSPRHNGRGAVVPQGAALAPYVAFSRRELNDILSLYGRMVAAGEWRDYALDFLRDKAVFSVFRRASEYPIYRIEKHPRLARRQGAFSVITPTGLILKRGQDLKRVLEAIEPRVRPGWM